MKYPKAMMKEWALNCHGVCAVDEDNATYVSMGVVKIDLCEPDWDTYEVQHGKKRPIPVWDTHMDLFITRFFEAEYNRLPNRGGA